MPLSIPYSLTLRASADSYLGDPLFSLFVDGVPLATSVAISVQRVSGNVQSFTYTTNLTPGLHTLTVDFLNDRFGDYTNSGYYWLDRNMYISSILSNNTLIPGVSGTVNAVNLAHAFIRPNLLSLWNYGAKATFIINANEFTGTSGADLLTGTVDADTIHGAAGNDTIFGLQGNDSIFGNEGDDSIDGGAGKDFIAGGNGSDTLHGGGGNDSLDGGAGADSMAGGGGSDTYYLDNAGDIVVEILNQGTDTVVTAMNYTLGANVENLTLTGAVGLFGTGNALDNVITGSNGADTLDGGAGADSMAGGNGNDHYNVDNAGDVIVETLNQGTDTVTTGLNFTLGNHLENLIFTGATGLIGTGNALNNAIAGSSGADTLNGASGNDTISGNDGNDSILGGAGSDIINGGNGADTLQGGTGNDWMMGGAGLDRLAGGTGSDVFSYASALAGNEDVITDFASGIDHFEILASGFGGGLLAAMNIGAAGRFVSNTSGNATQAMGQFIHETDVGKIWWDADGTGGGLQVLIARLGGLPAVVATDFVFI